MNNYLIATCVAVLLSGLGVLGDYCLRLASRCPSPLWTRWFLLGMVIFATSAFGWVYVFKHLKVSAVGAIYSASSVILLVTLGVGVFKETLTRQELIGIICAVAAVAMLGRFQE